MAGNGREGKEIRGGHKTRKLHKKCVGSCGLRNTKKKKKTLRTEKKSGVSYLLYGHQCGGGRKPSEKKESIMKKKPQGD